MVWDDLKINWTSIGQDNTKQKRRLTPADKKRIAAKQHYNCKACGKRFGTVYHIDHIKPLSKGGSDRESNLQALCPTCHAEKTEDDRHKEKQKLRKKKGSTNPFNNYLDELEEQNPFK